ncbi:MAG: SulA-like leucine-rich domain-containing protein [Endozoicomonas sp.]
MMQSVHRMAKGHHRTQPMVNNKASNSSSGTVNELILSGQPWQSGHILTPVLNELAREQERRWLTLILSDENANDTKSWLKHSGISSNRIQILNPGNSKKSLELTLKALASGTSHTVVSWLNQLDNGWLEKLENAAKSGHCQGLAIRKREAA